MPQSPKKNDTLNFLTCPAFPELKPPVGSSKTGSEPPAASSQSPVGKAVLQPGETEHVFPESVATSAPPRSPLARAIPPVSLTGPVVPPVAHPPRRILWIVAFVIAVIGLLTGPALLALTRAAWSAQAAKSALARAESAADKRDFAAAADEVGKAQANLRTVRDALRGVGFWRDAPAVGVQIKALENAADAGSAVLDGARDLLTVAAGVWEAAGRGAEAALELAPPVEPQRALRELTPEEKRSILARLDRALPDLRVAQAKIAVAFEAWNRVPQTELFAPLRRALQPVATTLPRFKRSLDEALPLLETVIPLLGYPEPADYLVVLQNSDEIRATGGFLGTVGVLQVDGGDLKRFEFDDVYNLDNPAASKWKEAPPEPLRRYTGVQSWFFRDANWSPDFPASAEKLLDFYARERALAGAPVKSPNGVIALNPPLFRELLRITGPLTADGFVFDQSNFFDLLQYEVEVGFLREGKIPISKRKALVAKLGNQLLEKLAALPSARWAELLDLATRALDRKQMQIYARDPRLLARLDALGWTGRAQPTQGDFLWVVDSNLAALKTDGVMTKRAAYALDARPVFGGAGGDPRPIATVTLRYTNNAPGFTEYRFTRYRDYVRLYVPEGSELIEVKGAMQDDRYRTGGVAVAGPVEVYKELGKTVFAAFWSIEPKTTQELVFRYRLPLSATESLSSGAYRLDWPKQSGNDAAALTLDLEFGKKLRRATPAEESAEHGDTRYRVTTDAIVDRTFEITF